MNKINEILLLQFQELIAKDTPLIQLMESITKL